MSEMTSYPIPTVRAIVCDKLNRVLILKRANTDYCANCWSLPGGKINYGQTAEDAVEEELLQETSLICVSKRFLFYQDGVPSCANEQQYITLYFECATRGNIRLNGESSAFAWVGPEELDKYDIAFGNDGAIRTHWGNRIHP